MAWDWIGYCSSVGARVHAMGNFIAFAFVVMAAANSVAQNLPDAPQPRFWTKAQVALTVMDGGAKTADFYYTHQTSLQPHAVETNFMYRPFVMHGVAAQAAFFTALWGADQIESYMLYRLGARRRVWRWLRYAPIIYGIGANAQGAHFSATHQMISHK